MSKSSLKADLGDGHYQGNGGPKLVHQVLKGMAFARHVRRRPISGGDSTQSSAQTNEIGWGVNAIASGVFGSRHLAASIERIKRIKLRRIHQYAWR